MVAFTVRADPPVDGASRVRVTGDVDLSVCDPLLITLLDVIGRDSVQQVVVDFTLVTFLDAAGIGALLTARTVAVGQGRRLRVVGARGLVQHVMEITGVQGVLGAKPVGGHHAWIG